MVELKNRPFPLRLLATLAMAGFLMAGVAACGGAPEQPENDPPPPPVDEVDPPPPPPVDEVGPPPPPPPPTPESGRSNFLPPIFAGARYYGSDGGSGITVAVIDDGVDFSHFDLNGHQWSYGDAYSPEQHGTPVAGVIAARRNGAGMHGVAWNASLVSLANCFTRGSDCSATERRLGQGNVLASDIASAAGLSRSYGNAASNPAASSHIMNMSWGPDLGYVDIGTSSQILSAMRDAAAAGRIMVAALGNNGLPGPEGGPASVMAFSGVAGSGIAVGALNSAGNGRASFSNACGTSALARYCLFAPGEGVYTTRPGSSYGSANGTSFASPVVAGAAAVVWGAFPNKSGRQIVARLLDTADRSGAFGNSSIYGRGRLNLEAALNPVGFTSLRFDGGGEAPVFATVIDLPSGFQAPNSLSGLGTVVGYDEQGFPFLHDLSAAFLDSRSSTNAHPLEGFLAALGGTRSYVPLSEAAAFEFTSSEEDSLDQDSGSAQSERDTGLRNFEAHFQPSPTVGLSLGHNVYFSGASNRDVLERAGHALLPAGSAVAPFTAFAERNALALNLAWQADARTTVDLVSQFGEDRFGRGAARLASTGLTHRIAGDWTAGARVGVLQEEQALLGIRSEGGFTGLSDTDTHFVDVSLAGPVAPDFALFTGMSRGRTDGRRSDGSASLVAGWGDVDTGSFLFGGEWTDPGIAGSDRLVLTVSSPFRARNAHLQLRVPTEEVADQELRYTTETVELTPSGRETRVQFVYETDWVGGSEGGSSVSLGGYVRLEPGHDAQADPDLGLGVKYATQF